MDNLLDPEYNLLRVALNDPEVRKSVKLLKIFGIDSSELIYVTNNDKVYCFGRNKNGCLGLGSVRPQLDKPILNPTLSGKRLVDIFGGLDHCIGLTDRGVAFAWGYNDYGRLGTGTVTNELIPEPIQDLIHKRIISISCGSAHTLAITNDLKVYSWGRNGFGQLGLNHFKNRYFPTSLNLSQNVVSIACGQNHSIALTDSGQALVWGINDCGQLGFHPRDSQKNIRGTPSQTNPIKLCLPKNESFKSVVCGRNHTLLLTNDGNIYAFGDNQFGQIGIGQIGGHNYFPFCLNKDIKVKEIIADNKNDISMAVGVDNKIYVWGLLNGKPFGGPKRIPDSFGRSVFDIHLKLAKNKITFKTIDIIKANNQLQRIINNNNNNNVVSGETKTDNSGQDFGFNQTKNVRQSVDSKPKFTEERKPEVTFKKEQINEKHCHQNCNHNQELLPLKDKKPEVSFVKMDTKEWNSALNRELLIPSKVSTFADDSSVDSDTESCIEFSSCLTSQYPRGESAAKFQYIVSQSFDNPSESDLKFVFNDGKEIFCHKTILQIRNKKFWLKCSEYLEDDCGRNQTSFDPPLIRTIYVVKNYRYKAFYTFLRYLYGSEPELDNEGIDEVLRLANTYEEPELRNLCYRLIERSEGVLDLVNVSSLYQKAINNNLKDLEKFCIEFAANNWKNVCKSDAFQAMDDKLSERLMTTIFRQKQN